MNIYVGNLSYDTDDAGLRAAFEAYGQVTSAQVIVDRETGRSRGFGFVEMPSEQEALAAIEALNGQELDGRRLNVQRARGGGGGRGSGGGRRESRRRPW